MGGIVEDRARGTFTCIDHSAPPLILAGEKIHFPERQSVDMGPVIEALKDLKVDVKMPDPEIIEITPAIHIPKPDPVVVNLSMPEMQPVIQVKPADVVIQAANGQPIPTPIIEINIPWWAVFAVGGAPIVVMIIEMVLRHS